MTDNWIFSEKKAKQNEHKNGAIMAPAGWLR